MLDETSIRFIPAPQGSDSVAFALILAFAIIALICLCVHLSMKTGGANHRPFAMLSGKGPAMRARRSPGPTRLRSVASPMDLPPSTEAGIDALRDCRVKAVPIMSREQAGVHALLEPDIQSRGLLMSSEVSMSAIFRVNHASDTKRAHAGFGAIRQKYLDLLITDRQHRPLCGIEYHGSGHWSGGAKRRDAAKAEAFRLANLPLIVVEKGYDKSEVLARVRKTLDQTARG